MSYMRVPHHVYRTSVLHDDDSATGLTNKHGDYISIDGDNWELDTFDELMVMRLAQMTVEETRAAVERAVKKHNGNFDCDALCVATGFLPPILHSSEKIESVLLPLFEREKSVTPTAVPHNLDLYRMAIGHCERIPGNEVLVIGSHHSDQLEAELGNSRNPHNLQDRVKITAAGRMTVYQLENLSRIYRCPPEHVTDQVRGMELGGVYIEAGVALCDETETILRSRLRLAAAKSDLRFVMAHAG